MKTAGELINYLPKYAHKDTGFRDSSFEPWAVRHMTATLRPKSFENPIVHLLKGWLLYADEHHRAYESSVGEDGVLGPEWEAIGQALLGLLNGSLGNLDGGTLDHIIREALKQNDFNPDK